jgi:hypothetical protein
VIAIEDPNVTPGLLGLVGESIQELEDLWLVVTSIELIAGLYDRGLAAAPMAGLVEDTGHAKGASGRLSIAVEITDRHHSFGGIDAEVAQIRRRALRRCARSALGGGGGLRVLPIAPDREGQDDARPSGEKGVRHGSATVGAAL